ncbi:hypothetical protein [Gymnodinialimonas hymeniacidonis]|uniref:hypothetical protein n=1 Tax=Gymnodinialimonas hymeniacidonis TaxID=3126508 RepID=UPI0034C61A89
MSVGAAQASPPGDQPFSPPQSVEEARFAIAWYGAACLLGASEVDLYGNIIRIEDVAEDSGVSVDRIRALSEARAAEHDIAVDVLRRGGEPLRDPPEPFLTILRQAQADCQDWDRSRRVLERELSADRLPDVSPPRVTALRDDIDPRPFDFERRQRLTAVIRGIDEALAAGDFAADLEGLLQAVSGRAGLTLEDVRHGLGIYSLLPNIDPAEALATDLLLPTPTQFADLTADEVAHLVERMETNSQDPFGRYYLGLVLVNVNQLDEAFVMMFRDRDTGATGEVSETTYPPRTCHNIAGSAALLCPSP